MQRSFVVRAVVTILIAASLVTAGPRAESAPEPVTINCGNPVGFDITEPGSYVLTGGVTNCGSATAAIKVSATDVKLDLDGFTIDGVDAVSTFGILALPDMDGFKVSNGTVQDFETGIRLGGKASKASGLTVQSNVTGIDALFDVTTGRSIANTISNNFVLANTGIGIDANHDNKISNNTISANAGGGILALNGNTVSGNTLTNNGATGLGVDHRNKVAKNTLTGDGIDAGDGNTIASNTLDGGAIGTFNGNTVKDNVLTDSVGTAISGFNGFVVLENRVTGGTGLGIDGFNGAVIRDNKVTGTSGHGIEVANGSTIVGNTSNDSLGGDGINAGSGATIKSNKTNDNADDGIDVTVALPARHTAIIKNVAKDNGDIGVFASASGVKGDGTNKATGNGTTDCDPASLCA